MTLSILAEPMFVSVTFMHTLSLLCLFELSQMPHQHFNVPSLFGKAPMFIVFPKNALKKQQILVSWEL